MYNLRTKTVMESSNVVINDEVCPEAHSESTAPVQDKPMKVNDLLPIDYVGKYSLFPVESQWKRYVFCRYRGKNVTSLHSR